VRSASSVPRSRFGEMSIREVAARAKVSTATISRTINHSAPVTPKTAERVWRVIRDLGFYPNTQARALASGKSRLFGLIVSDISNPFFPDLVKSFEYSAVQHGYEVIVANAGYHSKRIAGCIRRMIERNVDGVAVMACDVDPELIDGLSSRQLPVVLLDLGKFAPVISNITVDYMQGAQEAVQHLCSLGHRRVGFIDGLPSLRSARDRRTAVLSHLQSCRIGDGPQLVFEGNYTVDGGEAAMRQILACDLLPTAIIAVNDLTAIGALRAIHRAGLRVPEDITVVGFDDIELSQFTHPALTTVRLSREEIGRKAFDALHATIEDHSVGGQEISVSTSLVIRESSGAAKP
jgi:DNA-binding LacI/PurR family transcriptional regulator